jgi:DNA-binding NtrC family response regulator
MAETRKPSILVVDDEPDILFSLRALLRRDFEVHTAEGGAAALEVLHRHPVRVIMTDQRMPEMTGAELLHRARDECPEAIRIIFTGYADLKAVIDAVNRGEIYRYLTKPWDPDELCAVLRQACDHYEVLAERHRLLADARDHLAQALTLPAGPVSESWAEAGRALLARLDRAVGKSGTGADSE